MHEHVHSVGELARGGVVLAESFGAGTELGRAVIGEVRDAPSRGLDAVPVGSTALVRDLPREHLEAIVLHRSRFQRDMRPCAAQAIGTDREVRRRHHDRQHLERISLRGLHERDSRIVTIRRREERQALRVIPVEVREQDRTIERSRTEHRRQ